MSKLEKLPQKNLKFIFTEIPNLEFVRLTFVVQNNNYFEMVKFVEMADYYQKLNGMKTTVSFQHINNWGTFSNSEFMIKNIANINHPENSRFIKEVETLKSLREKYNNLEIFTNF